MDERLSFTGSLGFGKCLIRQSWGSGAGRRLPTTSHRVGDQNINLARSIRAHKQSTVTVKRHAHRPEAGARAFGVIRVGQDVGGGGSTRRRGDGLAVDEVDEGYFVADGLAPVP